MRLDVDLAASQSLVCTNRYRQKICNYSTYESKYISQLSTWEDKSIGDAEYRLSCRREAKIRERMRWKNWQGIGSNPEMCTIEHSFHIYDQVKCLSKVSYTDLRSVHSTPHHTLCDVCCIQHMENIRDGDDAGYCLIHQYSCVIPH